MGEMAIERTLPFGKTARLTPRRAQRESGAHPFEIGRRLCRHGHVAETLHHPAIDGMRKCDSSSNPGRIVELWHTARTDRIDDVVDNEEARARRIEAWRSPNHSFTPASFIVIRHSMRCAPSFLRGSTKIQATREAARRKEKHSGQQPVIRAANNRQRAAQAIFPDERPLRKPISAAAFAFIHHVQGPVTLRATQPRA